MEPYSHNFEAQRNLDLESEPGKPPGNNLSPVESGQGGAAPLKPSAASAGYLRLLAERAYWNRKKGRQTKAEHKPAAAENENNEIDYNKISLGEFLQIIADGEFRSSLKGESYKKRKLSSTEKTILVDLFRNLSIFRSEKSDEARREGARKEFVRISSNLIFFEPKPKNFKYSRTETKNFYVIKQAIEMGKILNLGEPLNNYAKK